MDDRKRVVVTGLGVANAAGLDETEFWRHLLAGETGIRAIAGFDASAYKTRIAAELDPAAFEERAAGSQTADKAVRMALLVSGQALAQAGLVPEAPPYSPQPIPVVFGTGAGCAGTLTESYAAYAAKGPRGLRPTTMLRCMANAISSQLSLHFRLTGSNYMTVSACTSSTIAIGIAFRMVRDGYARAVLCGGTESLLDPANFASWDNLGVMSRRADPATACRPFDGARDGCVLGEGAGALVLESPWTGGRASGPRCAASGRVRTRTTLPAPASKARPPPCRPPCAARASPRMPSASLTPTARPPAPTTRAKASPSARSSEPRRTASPWHQTSRSSGTCSAPPEPWKRSPPCWGWRRSACRQT
jgi:hypothetical protein